MIVRKLCGRYLIDEARKAVGLAVKPVGRFDDARFVGVDRAKAANRREHRIETEQNLRAIPPPSEIRQAHSEFSQVLI